MAEPATNAFLLAGALLFVLGFLGLTAPGAVIRRVIAANVLANGVFLVLVAIAARAGPDGPDPVPHAMVLTGIVVSVCGTGLALALSERVREARPDARAPGPPDPPSRADDRAGGRSAP